MDSPYGNYGSPDFKYYEADAYHRQKHDQVVKKNIEATGKLISAIIGITLLFGFLSLIAVVLDWLFNNWLLILLAILGVFGLSVLINMILTKRNLAAEMFDKIFRKS